MPVLFLLGAIFMAVMAISLGLDWTRKGDVHYAVSAVIGLLYVFLLTYAAARL